MGLVWVGDRRTCPPCFGGWGTKGTLSPQHDFLQVKIFVKCLDANKNDRNPNLNKMAPRTPASFAHRTLSVSRSAMIL